LQGAGGFRIIFHNQNPHKVPDRKAGTISVPARAVSGLRFLKNLNIGSAGVARFRPGRRPILDFAQRPVKLVNRFYL